MLTKLGGGGGGGGGAKQNRCRKSVLKCFLFCDFDYLDVNSTLSLNKAENFDHKLFMFGVNCAYNGHEVLTDVTLICVRLPQGQETHCDLNIGIVFYEQPLL